MPLFIICHIGSSISTTHRRLCLTLMVKHQCHDASLSHPLVSHFFRPIMCQDICNYKNISPDTYMHTHLLTPPHTHTHTEIDTHKHISTFPVSISGLNVPSITANYRSHRRWMGKRLTKLKYQSRRAAY